MNAALKDRLRGGQPMVGTFVSTADPTLAELVAEAVDIVVVDLEHGALGLRDMQNVAIAARAAEAHVLVRVPGRDSETLDAVLDSGVDGVVVPRIETADQAERLVRRLRYPPNGSRGYGPRRANRYGRDPGYWRTAADQLVCLAQIETAAGVFASGEIAAVEGVDALLLGPADLSFDLDRPLEARDDLVRRAIDTVQAAASDAALPFAFAGNVPLSELSELVDERCSVLLHSTDLRIYATAVDAVMSDARMALEQLVPARTEAGAWDAGLRSSQRGLRPF